MPPRRNVGLAEQAKLAIRNCLRSGKTQDWTVSGGLRITIAKRGEQTVALRLSRMGSIPSVTDVEFFRAALPQLYTAERTPEQGYNRTQDEQGRSWRWVMYVFTVEDQEDESRE